MTKARDLANAADVLDDVSATELSYVNGVTSAIQTQLDAKVAKSLVDAKGDLLVGSANDTVSRLAVASTAGWLLSVDSAETTGLKWAAPAAASFVGCILDDSGDQSISNNTATALTYNAEIVDTDGFHSTTTNTSRITIPSGKGGKYLFIAHIQSGVYASGAGYTATRIYKNGSSIAAHPVPNVYNFNTDIIHTYICEAVAGDYFELFAFQNTGSSQTIYKRQADGPGLQFACQFLG